MLVKNPLDLNKDKYYRYQILVSSVMRYCVQFENYAIEIAFIRVKVMTFY